MKYLFPYEVTGTIIVVIGIILSFSAVNDMSVLFDLSDQIFAFSYIL